MDLVSAELPAKTLVVGIDPGKAANRVLLATGEDGVLGETSSRSLRSAWPIRSALAPIDC
jgi:hypothetical protein